MEHVFTGVNFLGADGRFHYGDVTICGALISEVCARSNTAQADAMYLIPGLIDMHTHGACGADLSDGRPDDLRTMARYYAQNGVTRFSPATMSLDYGTIESVCENARSFASKKERGVSKLVGITLEGPFLSPEKKGAQALEHLKSPDVAFIRKLDALTEGLIRIVCVAPELEGAIPFIEEVSKRATVSAAHTNCTYDEAKEAIGAGLTHVTHLYNAMPPMLHRAPGLIAAASESVSVTAELIADGLHVHPAMVRAAYKLFGSERLSLISDSMSACGMPYGEYTLGGQSVRVDENGARLHDGTLAGSITPLFECMRRAVSFGIPLEHAVLMASRNPANVLGIEAQAIEACQAADLVLMTPSLDIEEVYIDGEKVDR